MKIHMYSIYTVLECILDGREDPVRVCITAPKLGSNKKVGPGFDEAKRESFAAVLP